MRRRLWLAGAVLALVAAGVFLLPRGPSLGRLDRLFRRPTNVLLVSIDTLRADHLGCYGYASADTPHLNALAARGTRFLDAVTVAPLTLPAHSSLMTGRLPAHHGVRDNGGYYLAEEETTLAELLRGRGYRTGGFVSAFVLDARWGINQGFDTFFDDFDLSKYEGKGMDAVRRRGDETVDRALAWLRKEPDRPFLAWVHLYDPHAPYSAPPEYLARFPPSAIGAYDAGIAWSDTLVGRLLQALAESGRLERTLVVAVGDHGESLGEHKEPTHGFFVYDATLRIPLVVAGPGVPTGVVGAQVRIIDVLPTLLDLLRIEAKGPVDGRSLMPLARGDRVGEEPALSESWYPRLHYGWSELVSLRTGRFKLIKAPRPELYDLKADPGETNDLAASDPERLARMLRELERLQTRLGRGKIAEQARKMDPEVEERLEALGYTAGGPGLSGAETRPRGDPKDKIELYNLLKAAGGASAAGRVDEAIEKAQAALSRDPEIVEGHMLLGNFLMKEGKLPEAAAAYRRAIALDPQHEGATFGLGTAYKKMGQLDDARTAFERARALEPRATKPLWQLADLAMQAGQFERAEADLKEALSRKADRPGFLLKLAECYIEMKRYDSAEEALLEAQKGKGLLPALHYDRALVFEARGESQKAMAEYEAELNEEPSSYRASFNLGKLLLQSGRAEEAALRFQASVAASPGFSTGYLYLGKALLDGGRLKEAEDAEMQGLRRKPTPDVAPLGHYVLADIMNRAGRTSEAARELKEAQRLEAQGR